MKKNILGLCFLIICGCGENPDYKGEILLKLEDPVYVFGQLGKAYTTHIQDHTFLASKSSNGFYSLTHDPDCSLCMKRQLERDLGMLIIIRDIVHGKIQSPPTPPVEKKEKSNLPFVAEQ